MQEQLYNTPEQCYTVDIYISSRLEAVERFFWRTRFSILKVQEKSFSLYDSIDRKP